MMIKKYLWATLFLVLISTQANSADIKADATGFNSADTDFWGVKFDSGSGFIKSVKFDLSPLFGLSPTTDGLLFDFDGESSPGNPFPVGNLIEPLIGQKSGLSDSDISHSLSGESQMSASNYTMLEYFFAPNSFVEGDSFKFSAEVDAFFEPVSAGFLGSPLGLNGLLFSVTMQDDSVFSGNFVSAGISNSGVTVNTPSAIPLPATVWLFGSGLLAITARRKKIQVVQL